MRAAIATVCLSRTLAEEIEAIAAAQFKGVEIIENDLLSFNGTPADARLESRAWDNQSLRARSCQSSRT